MIRLTQIEFGYGRKRLFSNMDLSIPAGGICGLLGKNGVGKTSLLKLIAGLRFPRSGACTVLEHPSAGRSVDLLQDLFFLPEEFTLPAVPVETYAAMFAPFYPRFDPDRLQAYLRGFELPLDQSLHAFSFGQKKKFILAFGLASGCRIMLLDEPTNGLDIPSKSQFRRMMASEFSQDRLFLIATHQARDLERIIDSVIILADGEIAFNQSLASVSQRLSIHVQADPPDSKTALYVETCPGGYAVVSPNDGSRETPIDIELLFNAVTTNTRRIQHLFHPEAPHAVSPRIRF